MSTISGGGTKWDHDAVFVNDNRSEGVDHGASAKANLRAAGEDLRQAVLPDKMAEQIDGIRHGDGLQRFFGTLLLPVAAVVDVAEVALKPLVAVKDMADSAIHGILSLFGKK